MGTTTGNFVRDAITYLAIVAILLLAWCVTADAQVTAGGTLYIIEFDDGRASLMLPNKAAVQEHFTAVPADFCSSQTFTAKIAKTPVPWVFFVTTEAPYIDADTRWPYIDGPPAAGAIKVMVVQKVAAHTGIVPVCECE